MPPQELLCPNCRSIQARWLKDTSQDADADYYLCSDCGHVWTIAKGSQHLVRNVTPLAESGPERETSYYKRAVITSPK